ncbi:MAG: arginine--tRNA ligase, partial [bacterium]|nr:arginine--tRNA ligase [bacterium]
MLNKEKPYISAQSLLSGKKVAVEYTDPNPFKEFHLGHLYSNVIGESIARLFEACGATVWRGDFYGDVGMHVAKSVWGMMKKMREDKITLIDLEKLPLNERQAFLGKGYALGVVKYDEDEQTQKEIKDINLLIYIAGQKILKKTKGWQPIINYRQYLKGDEDKLREISKIYEAGLKWSLEYFETIYKRLGTKFDGYYPESWVGEYGIKIVEKGLKLGVLEKTEGVVVYRGEKDGLHTRVFVNKLGLPTYEAKDLGLAYAKNQDFKYDLSINVFGKEIDEYYKVVRAAMIQIEPDLGKKADYIAHGMVKLPEGKMSSRTGNVVTYEWLMEEAKKYALKIMTSKDFNEQEKQRVAGSVGAGAVRYALLKNNIGNDIIFDFEKSISLEGNSGPYLQYSYARCRSVLRKVKNESIVVLAIPVIPAKAGIQNLLDPRVKPEDDKLFSCSVSQLAPEELALLRTLYKFPEVILEAVKNFAPNLLCNFLYDLAQKYNLFYDKHPILKAETSELVIFRLGLTEATGKTIKTGLELLGIQAPERM